MKLSPAVDARVSVPFDTDRLSCSSLSPASGSLTWIGVPALAEKTSGVSSAVVSDAGPLRTGASLACSTVMGRMRVVARPDSAWMGPIEAGIDCDTRIAIAARPAWPTSGA